MKDKIKVVCMGDSITEGYGIDGKPEGPYPAQLQLILGDGFRVFNQGVSCTCTINRELDAVTVGQPYMLEDKYDKALELKGDIYVIMLGTNDAQDGCNDETGVIDQYYNVFALRQFFKDDYLKIVNRIRNANGEARILMVKPVPVMECIWKKHQQSFLEVILPEFDRINAEVPSLIALDLQKVFLEYAYEERMKLYQADGLHPNEEGAKVIAENIGKVIRMLPEYSVMAD